jgi:hypothetical protein
MTDIDEVTETCPACGWRLRFRGRRGSTTVYSCDDETCPTCIVEVLDRDRAGERAGRQQRPALGSSSGNHEHPRKSEEATRV